MKKVNIESLTLKIVDKFPNRISKIAFKIIVETRFLFFRIKWSFQSKNIPNPVRIYWISPNRL